jgi:ferredoxin
MVPEVFEVDEDDNLHILDPEVPAALAAGVRHVVRRCPKAALSIDD